MLSDIAIAQAAKPKPIREVAAELGLVEDDLELYGRYKAKVQLDSINKRGAPKGRLVLVENYARCTLSVSHTLTQQFAIRLSWFASRC